MQPVSAQHTRFEYSRSHDVTSPASARQPSHLALHAACPARAFVNATHMLTCTHQVCARYAPGDACTCLVDTPTCLLVHATHGDQAELIAKPEIKHYMQGPLLSQISRKYHVRWTPLFASSHASLPQGIAVSKDAACNMTDSCLCTVLVAGSGLTCWDEPVLSMGGKAVASHHAHAPAGSPTYAGIPVHPFLNHTSSVTGQDEFFPIGDSCLRLVMHMCHGV